MVMFVTELFSILMVIFNTIFLQNEKYVKATPHNESCGDLWKFCALILVSVPCASSVRVAEIPSNTASIATKPRLIRTPMNVILGYNQLMKSQLTEPKQLDYQKEIEQSGKLLLSIINNALDIARIESGR